MPDNENIHINRALVYVSVQSCRETCRGLEKALALKPEFEDARDLIETLDKN